MTARKIGSAARYGARHGKRIRTIVAEVEKRQHRKHRCVSCKRLTLRRIAGGIYRCTKCRHTFTGLAYTPA